MTKINCYPIPSNFIKFKFIDQSSLGYIDCRTTSTIQI